MTKMSARTHGAIDYAASAAMLGLPVGMKWDGRAGTLLRAAGLAAIVYSFFTNYERGAIRVIPMKAHLALDAVSGVALLGAAALLRDADPDVRATLAGVGAFEIAAALTTEPQSNTERRRLQSRGHATMPERMLSRIGVPLGPA